MAELEKIQLPGGNVNRPQSGTYGEKAAEDRLKQALPAMDPAALGGSGPAAPPISPDPVRQQPATVGRPSTGAAAPPGVPSVLLRPTDRPHVPVNTPLAQPQAPATGTPSQARLALLDMLANNPDVSAATREWARTLLEILTGGQAVGLG